MRKLPLLIAGIGISLCAVDCGGSKNAGNPAAPTASSQVSASVSPVPVPVHAQNGAGSSAAQYRIAAEVTFHDSSGRGGRISQITLALVNGGSRGNSQTIAVDLALPVAGFVKQQIVQTLDAPAGQAPSALQLTAAGQDTTGTAFVVPAVQAPLVLAESAATGPFNRVVIVVEENARYDDVIGNPLMPYLNSLATQYAVATQYYSNTHPSIGNYFMLTVGTIVSNSDSFSGIVTDDNIVRQLLVAGKTWKSYAEDLPSVGYTGGDTGRYARRHNVLALLSDVARDAAQARNLVPFTDFSADLAGNALPNYSFVVPNLCNDGHDCPLSTADGWLQANIGPLVSSRTFQQDGLLIVLFDEAADSDATHGGGRVAWVAVSAKSKRGYRSTTLYQHESTLRLTAEALGLTVFPNRAATASSMTEFFTSF